MDFIGFDAASQQAVQLPDGARWTVRVERVGAPMCPTRWSAVPIYLARLSLRRLLNRADAWKVVVVNGDWTDNDVALSLSSVSRGWLQPAVGVEIWGRSLTTRQSANAYALEVRNALVSSGGIPDS